MVEERTVEEALRRCVLFEGLEPEDREALLAIAGKRRFPRNHLVFREGERADGFYLILSGGVKVYKISPEGKEHILHIFGEGEPLGEVAVFSGRNFPAFATTLKASALLFFPRSGFLDLAYRNPRILLNMLATLSVRLRGFARKIEQLSLKEVASRLAETLLEMAGSPEGAPGEGAVELAMTKAQLASQIGTTPETLSRTFLKLSRQGLIRVEGRRVSILDRGGLEEVAAGTGAEI